MNNENRPRHGARGRRGRPFGRAMDYGPGFPFGAFPPFPLGPMFGAGHRGHGPEGPGFAGPGRRARRGDVRMAILHLLSEEPRNGYQIIQELSARTDGLWKPSPGAVYPAMSALEDEGLIVPDARNPKVFTLTHAGRDAIEESPEAPWATFQDAGRSFHESRHGDLWREFGKLAEALRAVAMNATPDQLGEAFELLARTRRELFALLAQHPDEGSTDESDDDAPASDG